VARTQSPVARVQVGETPKVDEKTVKDLIAKLEGNFQERTKAAADLEMLGLGALPAIQKALDMKGKTLELTQRITNIRNRVTASKQYGSVLKAAEVPLPDLYQDASDDQKKAITKLLMNMQEAVARQTSRSPPLG
jgi:hypothetical protein